MIYIIKLVVVFVTYMGVGTFILNNDFEFKISEEEMTNLDYKIQQEYQLKQELYDLDNKLKKDMKEEKDKLFRPTEIEKFYFRKKIEKLKSKYLSDRKRLINKYKN